MIRISHHLKACLAILTVLLFALPGQASDIALLLNDIGAQPSALGGAYTAEASHIYALHYNPAAGSRQTRAVAASTFFSIYETDIKDVSVLFPTQWGTLSAGFLKGDMGSIPYTALDENLRPYTTGGSFTYGVTRFTFGWSDVLSHFSDAGPAGDAISLGLQLEHVREDLEKSQGSATLLNLGGLYELNERLIVGAKVYNLLGGNETWQGNSEAVENLNTRLQAGLQYDVIPDVWYVALDYCLNQDDPLRMGTRYQAFPGIAFAAGMRGTALSAGIHLAVQNVFFDYSYSTPRHEAFSSTSRFSIGYEFPAGEAGKREPRKQTATADTQQLIDRFYYVSSEEEKLAAMERIGKTRSGTVRDFFTTVAQLANSVTLRQAALDWLCSAYPEDALTLLINFLYDPDSNVRMLGAYYLGHLRNQEGAAVMRQLLPYEPDPEVRTVYREALLMINPMQ